VPIIGSIGFSRNIQCKSGVYNYAFGEAQVRLNPMQCVWVRYIKRHFNMVQVFGRRVDCIEFFCIDDERENS
jgi:hypothetical protein